MPPLSWNVSEIFYSVQGEGRHTGMPAVFLRLSGCTMGCDFCDTKYAFAPGTPMNSLQILVELAKYPCKTVVVTGGEPAEQDLPALINMLKSAGHIVHIETNGAHDCDVSNADFVCVSPKKTVCENMLKKANVIKLVIGPKTTLQEVEKYYIYESEKTTLYFQPQDNLQENTNKCLQLVKNHPTARLSVQLHKLINVK